MDFLQNLLDNSNIPVITAFLLGLLTAISPCPLATNITAIGFISRQPEQDFFRRIALYLGACCGLYSFRDHPDFYIERGFKHVFLTKRYK